MSKRKIVKRWKSGVINFLIIILSTLPIETYAFFQAHMTKIALVHTFMDADYYDLEGYIDSWEDDESALNPCYQNVNCIVRTTSWIGNISDADGTTGHWIRPTNIKTMKEVITLFKQTNIIPGFHKGSVFTTRRPPPKNICFKISWGEQKDWEPTKWTAFPGHCVTIPPVDETLTCSITGDLVLNHGYLETKAVNGHKANSTLAVTCNKDAGLTITALGSGGNGDISLKPDNSLKSTLAINNQPASGGVHVDVKANSSMPFTVTSELIQQGNPEEGPFHGSGTVLLTHE